MNLIEITLPAGWPKREYREAVQALNRWLAVMHEGDNGLG